MFRCKLVVALDPLGVSAGAYGFVGDVFVDVIVSCEVVKSVDFVGASVGMVVSCGVDSLGAWFNSGGLSVGDALGSEGPCGGASAT